MIIVTTIMTVDEREAPIVSLSAGDAETVCETLTAAIEGASADQTIRLDVAYSHGTELSLTINDDGMHCSLPMARVSHTYSVEQMALLAMRIQSRGDDVELWFDEGYISVM